MQKLPCAPGSLYARSSCLQKRICVKRASLYKGLCVGAALFANASVCERVSDTEGSLYVSV